MQNLLTDILQNQLGDNFSHVTEQKLGVSHAQAKSAINAALPFLLGGLSKNASSSNGVHSLQKALAKHTGDDLDNMENLFNSEKQGDGKGILNHVLGQKQNGLQSYIAKQTGMDAETANSFLQSLAPAVMGAVGKVSNGGSGDISGVLQAAMKSMTGGKGGVSSALVTKFLDSDGDGEIWDDVAKIGFGMLKKMFFGR